MGGGSVGGSVGWSVGRWVGGGVGDVGGVDDTPMHTMN